MKTKKEEGKALGRVPLSQLALQKGSIDNKLTCPKKTGPEFILGFGVKTLDI